MIPFTVVFTYDKQKSYKLTGTDTHLPMGRIDTDSKNKQNNTICFLDICIYKHHPLFIYYVTPIFTTNIHSSLILSGQMKNLKHIQKPSKHTETKTSTKITSN